MKETQEIKQEIEKPTVLKLKELENNLIQSINNANLPMFVIEPVIKELLMQISSLKEREYQEEMQKYNELVEKNKKKGE